jgi:hypothetical protein
MPADLHCLAHERRIAASSADLRHRTSVRRTTRPSADRIAGGRHDCAGVTARGEIGWRNSRPARSTVGRVPMFRRRSSWSPECVGVTEASCRRSDANDGLTSNLSEGEPCDCANHECVPSSEACRRRAQFVGCIRSFSNPTIEPTTGPPPSKVSFARRSR